LFLYLDVEGDPEWNFVYLIGMILDRGGEEERYSFWADDEEGKNGSSGNPLMSSGGRRTARCSSAGVTRQIYFTWAFYDLRFGPDRETIGTRLLDVGEPLGLGPDGAEAIRLMSETRMGVSEHAGLKGGRCLLRELITDDEFECGSPAGYLGRAGELWFVRLCPPIDPAGYQLAFTTPSS
jgi:hypothetical protein